MKEGKMELFDSQVGQGGCAALGLASTSHHNPLN